MKILQQKLIIIRKYLDEKYGYQIVNCGFESVQENTFWYQKGRYSKVMINVKRNRIEICTTSKILDLKKIVDEIMK